MPNYFEIGRVISDKKIFEIFFLVAMTSRILMDSKTLNSL